MTPPCTLQEKGPKEAGEKAKAKVKKIKGKVKAKTKEKVRTKTKEEAKTVVNGDHQLPPLPSHPSEVPHLPGKETECHASHTPKTAYANDQINRSNANSGIHPFAPLKGKARENAEKETNVVCSTLRDLP